MWVACDTESSPQLGEVELAVKPSHPDQYVTQLQTAADQNIPLYIFSSKVSAASDARYKNTI
jgi:hypothetical protein